MKLIYDNLYIKDNELLFAIFVISIILTILITIFIGCKENSKK